MLVELKKPLDAYRGRGDSLILLEQFPARLERGARVQILEDQQVKMYKEIKLRTGVRVQFGDMTFYVLRNDCNGAWKEISS